MFATLDPTLRKLRLPSRRLALLSDTVGFMRNLPPTLIQAFRATLEEVTEAALILHVVDAAGEHRATHRQAVDRVLHELAASSKPQLLVLNKCDLLQQRTPATSEASAGLGGAAARAVQVSARTGEGLDTLLRAVDDLLVAEPLARCRYRFDYGHGRDLALLYRQGQVLERCDGENGVEVVAEVPPALARRLQPFSTDSAANGLSA